MSSKSLITSSDANLLIIVLTGTRLVSPTSAVLLMTAITGEAKRPCPYLVIFKNCQLDLLLLVLGLLGRRVVLLLALLGATTQTEHQMECGLLLDVVVTQSATILQLLAREDQTLLIRGDSWETDIQIQI